MFVPEAQEASAPICNSKYDKYRGIRLDSNSPSRKSSAPRSLFSKRREHALPSDVRYPAAAGRRGEVCSLGWRREAITRRHMEGDGEH